MTGTVRYLGGRRGSDSDAISRDKRILPSDTVAQALTAFHGKPNIAYMRKGKIWEDNNLYDSVFNGRTSAHHIVFVMSLLRCIESKKLHLKELGKERTRTQTLAHNFFSYRGSTLLLLAAMGHCVDEYAPHTVHDKFKIRFKKRMQLVSALSEWEPVVNMAINVTKQLEPAVHARLREGDVSTSIENFASLFSSLAATIGEQGPFGHFKTLVSTESV